MPDPSAAGARPVRHVTGRAAVLGRPIGHSLSPLLHSAAYAALKLDWRYDAIECDESQLPQVLADRADWAGFSCTMPLKRAVLEVADEVRPTAVAAGAGNTLLPREGGGWIAENTDVDGIIAAVREAQGAGPPWDSVTVLGAGGTAQAAVVALARLGAPACRVLVRNPDRTAAVRTAAEVVGLPLTVARLDRDAPELAADLVVSTLPPGAGDALAGAIGRQGQTVLDVVYEPWPTALAQAAAEQGARVVSGAMMLLHQAAAQVELMCGRPAPVAAMRAALRSARPAAVAPPT